MASGKASFLNGSHWGIYRAQVADGRVTGVTPFERDPAPSPLIETIPSMVHNEARIAQPMVRAGYHAQGWRAGGHGRGAEPFVPVSWDEALDLVAGELERVKEAHGNSAIYAGSPGWGGPGKFHNAKTHMHRLFAKFGGFTGSRLSYSTAAATVILPHVLGTLAPVNGPMTTWSSIAEAGELMVAFGGLPQKNLQIDMGGGVHEAEQWLKRIREAGVAFVNIGPIRDDAAAFLDAEWLAPRPNTDTALMLGLAHTLVAENLHDKAFLARHSVGFEAFEPYLMGEADGQPKDADWAAPITEIPAETIRALARRMAGSRTMINVAYSLQRADHGEQPFWMVVVLAAMLGQIGLPGGGITLGYGTSGAKGNQYPPVTGPSVAADENPVDNFIPCARISDMLLNPGGEFDFNGRRLTYPHIRLVYWVGGNPFHHHQDLNRLREAWQKPDTIIIHEPWWTPAARRADIVLPATTQLERNDIGWARGHRFVYAMEKAIAPLGEARTDYHIFASLAERLDLGAAYGEGRGEMDWVRHIYDRWRQRIAQAGIEVPGFDAFWEKGYFEIPEAEAPHVLFADFRADPQAHPLKTPSGRIEIFSETVAGFGYDCCPGHPVWMEPAEWLGAKAASRHPLHLISNQSRWRLHSQADCAEVSRAHKLDGREPVLLNPRDAAARGIGDGHMVRVFNDRGSCLAGARLTDAVRPGVVALATGAWYDPEAPEAADSLDKHGNPNTLTRDAGTSKLAQGSSAQSTLVEVERHTGPLPDITAYMQPEIVAAGE